MRNHEFNARQKNAEYVRYFCKHVSKREKTSSQKEKNALCETRKWSSSSEIKIERQKKIEAAN
jgi:hypothetical protein